MRNFVNEQFGLVRRPWGVFYLKDRLSGVQTSLKTKNKVEAQRLLHARNEAQAQPQMNLSLARVYMNAADPALSKRTWQEVMDCIVRQRTDSTKERWERAIQDKAFDGLRHLVVTETRAEHFYHALEQGRVATNVYLRRIHNHALGMDWLFRAIIPRLLWPKPIFKVKRSITAAEHAAILEREPNSERKDFYELLWHTGASQGDAACLVAEDVNWEARTICYSRKKLKSHGSQVKPALIRFGQEVADILERRPRSGPIFPYLRTVRAGDRATEFHQRCEGLGIEGVTLHSYRYAWAERALRCGYPERFAQQALGHNSKAVHHAYSKNAEVTVPSLDDWEKDWKKNPHGIEKPKLVPVDFTPRPPMPEPPRIDQAMADDYDASDVAIW